MTTGQQPKSDAHNAREISNSSLEAKEITQAAVSQQRPWVRFGARSIDHLLFTLIFFCVNSLCVSFLPSLDPLRFVTFMESYVASLNIGMFLICLVGLTILLFFGIFFAMALGFTLLEAACFALFGTTPGKAWLRIAVRNADGSRLTFTQAFKRTWLVWWKGLALGFPIINLITYIIAYRKLMKQKVTTWDKRYATHITHQKNWRCKRHSRWCAAWGLLGVDWGVHRCFYRSITRQIN